MQTPHSPLQFVTLGSMMKCIELYKVNSTLENVNICEKVSTFMKKETQDNIYSDDNEQF